MSDNEYWLGRLRSVPGLEYCDLPSGVRLFGRMSEIRMELIPGAVSENMQEDHAAFEAWCLALRVHCDVEKIQLSVPSDAPIVGTHSNRFRYRMRCFQELFPDLVTIHADTTWLSTPFGDIGELRINKSYDRKTAPHVEPWTAMQSAKADSEAQLEFGLEVSPAFRRAFNIETVMRQWPVGIFQGAVKREHELLPRHKSAIDLIAVGDAEAPLYIFELKKADNRKAGIVGELLFYTAVMRDVLLGSISYEDERAARHCALAPSDILSRKKVTGVFITNGKHHPLVEQGAIVSELNRVAADIWQLVPVNFRVAKITRVPTSVDEDFEIQT